jgi:hypothetical protein
VRATKAKKKTREEYVVAPMSATRAFFKECAEERGEDASTMPLFLEEDHYDSAIVGMTMPGWGASENHQIIYDYEKVILAAMKANKWSYDEAAEWHDYNTQRSLAYYPGICPIFINVKPKGMK